MSEANYLFAIGVFTFYFHDGVIRCCAMNFCSRRGCQLGRVAAILFSSPYLDSILPQNFSFVDTRVICLVSMLFVL